MTESAVRAAKKLPDLASIIDMLGLDRLLYVVGQKIGSHHIHGTWPSLLMHYLEEREGLPLEFSPRGHHCSTHINQYMLVPVVLLSAMKSYVRWAFEENELQGFIALFETTEGEIQQVYDEVIAADDERLKQQ